MPETTELGHEGKFKYGTGALVEVANITDLNMDMNGSEIDATTRANLGWRNRRVGLLQWGAAFNIVVKLGDTAFKAMETAFLAKSIGNAEVADKHNNKVAGEVYITQFNRGEPLDGVVTIACTIVGAGKPTVT